VVYNCPCDSCPRRNSCKVEKTYTKEVTKTIDGSEITRKGEQGNKALFIKQDDGSSILKLEDEVEKQ
jgi:hypothetical protein